MHKTASWFKRLVIFSALAMMVAAVVMREELHRLVAVQTLFDEDRIVENFSSLDQLFYTVPIARSGGTIVALPKGKDLALPAQTETWIADQAVTSLLILHEGQIVHESYHLGTKREDLRVGWALSKPYLSALTGVLLESGTIGSLDDQATQYVPELSGTAYEGTRLRDLLQMTSGVTFNQDYQDYDSDINRMSRKLALGSRFDEFPKSLKEKSAKVGEIWHYNSIDAHVLAMVLRAATGQSMPELLSTHLMQNLGQEGASYLLADSDNVAFAPGGLNHTTRDFARFGLLYEQMGAFAGKQIVPENWVAASIEAKIQTTEENLKYGYHWWVPEDARPGQFFAHGFYGQYIFVDQAQDVVIVSTGANLNFLEPGVHAANISFFQSIADSL